MGCRELNIDFQPIEGAMRCFGLEYKWYGKKIAENFSCIPLNIGNIFFNKRCIIIMKLYDN